MANSRRKDSWKLGEESYDPETKAELSLHSQQ
jgi:hypothetical protein